MKQITLSNKADLIGVSASILCMLHCAATPFIFIATACSASCCKDAPFWWGSLDFIFLFISFFAVNRATQLSTKPWIKLVFWLSWLLLMGSVFLEQIGKNPDIFYLKHSAALSLIGFHLFNLVYCQYKEDNCCVNN